MGGIQLRIIPFDAPGAVTLANFTSGPVISEAFSVVVKILQRIYGARLS
jgi:hypothetical protein